MAELEELEASIAAAEGATARNSLIERLRVAPQPRVLIQKLSRSDSADVRGWVAAAAPELLGSQAVPLLTALLDDPEADIRVMALSAIDEIDPAAVPRLARRLRPRLKSANPYEALATSWMLARIGDRESVPLLEAYRDGFDADLWQHKAADVVLLYMNEPDTVLDRIRGHDHDRMGWLAYAARLIGTREALAALRDCATSAADERCRSICASRLA
jgi:HEAT repeat protein